MAKRMLAAGPGGDKVWTLLGMVEGLFDLDPRNTDWDLCAGISAGSLIAAMVSQVPVGDPKAFVANVEHFKTILLNPHFHPLKPWHSNTWINALSTLLWHGSFYRNGVEVLVRDYLHEPKREFRAGAFNMTTSEYQIFRSLEGVPASCAVPLAFPVVTINGQRFTDGSLAYWIPVQEIKEFVRAHEGPKIIDLLLCYPMDHDGFIATGATTKGKQLVCNGLETLNQRNWLTFQQNCQELEEFLGIDVKPGVHVKDNLTIRIFAPRKHRYSDFTHMDCASAQKLIEEGKAAVARMQEGASSGTENKEQIASCM